MYRLWAFVFVSAKRNLLLGREKLTPGLVNFVFCFKVGTRKWNSEKVRNVVRSQKYFHILVFYVDVMKIRVIFIYLIFLVLHLYKINANICIYNNMAVRYGFTPDVFFI